METWIDRFVLCRNTSCCGISATLQHAVTQALWWIRLNTIQPRRHFTHFTHFTIKHFFFLKVQQMLIITLFRRICSNHGYSNPTTSQTSHRGTHTESRFNPNSPSHQRHQRDNNHRDTKAAVFSFLFCKIYFWHKILIWRTSRGTFTPDFYTLLHVTRLVFIFLLSCDFFIFFLHNSCSYVRLFLLSKFS